MKVFAIQKAQVNTGASQFKQNSSGKQNPVRETNLTGDKFLSRVSFSGGKTVKSLEADLGTLTRRFEIGELTEEAYETAARKLNREIYQLKCDLGIIEASGPPPMGPDN